MVAVKRAADRLHELRFQAFANVLDDAAHQIAGGCLGFFRHQVFHRQNGAGQIEGRLDIGHEFRLEQQFFHAASLDGVVLQEDDHIFGEKRADLVEPFRHARKRPSLDGAVLAGLGRRFPLLAADFFIARIDGLQRFIRLRQFAGK